MTDTNSTRSRRSVLRAGALGRGAAAFCEGAACGTTAADRAVLAAATSPTAQFYSAPMAPHIRNLVVYHWLEGVL
jgi:hypothetical protein